MIEGLKALVWWHEAVKRGLVSKCETCMETRTAEQRQLLGCGYLPPPEESKRAYVRPWAGLGYKDKQPTVCPGYTTSLPETIEAARARLHWEKGGPAAIGVTDWEADPLTQGIEILSSQMGEFQMWIATPSSKGGGAG